MNFRTDPKPDKIHQILLLQEEGTSAGLDGGARMTRGARTADETAAGDLAPVTYNYSFFHLIFALASTYIAMLMTGALGLRMRASSARGYSWSSQKYAGPLACRMCEPSW